MGELSEIFQWRGDEGCAPGLPLWSEEDKVHLGEEMADVLLYLLRLADRCQVDLPAAAKRKLQRCARAAMCTHVVGREREEDREGDDIGSPFVFSSSCTL